MKNVTVTLQEGADSKRLPLNLNGKAIVLEVGVPKEITEEFIEVLDTANVAYSLGSSASNLLDILDGSAKDVKAAIAGMGVEDLSTLMAAEEDGNTRKSVVKAISDELEAASKAAAEPVDED